MGTMTILQLNREITYVFKKSLNLKNWEQTDFYRFYINISF
jgi:hypothetical protein